jgi:hypothetical protein
MPTRKILTNGQTQKGNLTRATGIIGGGGGTAAVSCALTPCGILVTGAKGKIDDIVDVAKSLLKDSPAMLGAKVTKTTVEITAIESQTNDKKRKGKGKICVKMNNSYLFKKFQCVLVGLLGFFLLAAGIYKYLTDSHRVTGELVEYKCELTSEYRSSYDHQLLVKGKGVFYSTNPVNCEKVNSRVVINSEIKLVVRNNEFLSAAQNNIDLIGTDALKSDDITSFFAMFGLGVFLSYFSIKMWSKE